MKAFEKWDKRVKITTWSGNTAERQERKWYREQTWKAALKWALTQDTDLNATELAYAIDKELNGTSEKKCR